MATCRCSSCSLDANQRTDGYGGSLTARLRFVVETLEAMAEAIGAGCVGLRICPGNPYNDMHDDDPAVTYGALLDAIAPLGLRIPAREPLARSRTGCVSRWRGGILAARSSSTTASTARAPGAPWPAALATRSRSHVISSPIRTCLARFGAACAAGRL
ncbi:oxidoreductase [Cupriavidus basilensis]